MTSPNNMNDVSVQASDEGYRHDDSIAIGLVSADSHITEPPNCYIDHIDPAYRETAPHLITGPNGGAVFVVPGMAKPIPLGIVAAAGIKPEAIRFDETAFEDLHRGGWDPVARVADQDRDGVVAAVIYPSVGMLLCNHDDPSYKRACFDAYNRWLQEFQSAAPDRLYGMAQIAVTSVSETVDDLVRIKEMGFKGVMVPCDPSTDIDYDDPQFDPVWRAAVDLGLPLSFHVLTSGRNKGGVLGMNGRGTKVSNAHHAVIRANQDVIALFIWGGVFERFPDLKIVCVEADAGWAPHFMYRMDHFYKRHRHWSKTRDLARLPSEYFRENVYLTFQDDWTAFRQLNDLNPSRLLWANDFPHSDSTWPLSRSVLSEHTAGIATDVKQKILRDNVIDLYGLHVPTPMAIAAE